MPANLSWYWPILVGLIAFLLVLLAEKLHFRRIDAAARLALGPSGEVRRWVKGSPWIRAASLGGMIWALATLLLSAGGIYQEGASADDGDERHRVVFLADLSPSMHLADAGPDGEQLRIERMSDVVDAVLERLEGQVLLSVICFYTDVLPAVVEAEDGELVRNIFDGLPVWYVMESGKTDLGRGIRESLAMLGEQEPGSTTLFICTDGDTLPTGRLPRSPESVRDVYVLGVGNPKRGTFIDDHLSRQNAPLLSSIAGRLGGQYIDVNQRHVPTRSLGALATAKAPPHRRWKLVDVAIHVFAGAATLLALLPVALALLGTDWHTVSRASRTEAVTEGL